jgi:hypothetical protein
MSNNTYYATVYNTPDNMQLIPDGNIVETLAVDSKVFRRKTQMIGKNKSVGPDDISGDILKLGAEAMIPYLTRLLDITLNNGSIPDDWKKATVIPVHKGGDRSIIPNYRPVSLTSVTCKQTEHAIASYLRQVGNREGWLYEGQHGFR